jgi:hypothetical protein
MFWSKSDREARRQKVLDELLEVDSADRRRRLDEAVAAGDVRAGEVEQALRLVARLDALRVMTIPHVNGGLRPGSESGLESEAESEDAAPELSASAGDEPQLSAGRVTKAKERRARARRASRARDGGTVKRPQTRTSHGHLTEVPVVREPAAVPVEPDASAPTQREPDAIAAVDPRILAAPLPIDAVESAARLMARNLAVRKSGPTSAATRRREHPTDDSLPPPAEPVLTAASGASAEAAAPSIDWLRP